MAQHILADCNRVIFLDIGPTQYLKARERLVLLYIGIIVGLKMFDQHRPNQWYNYVGPMSKMTSRQCHQSTLVNNTANKMSTLVQQMTALSLSLSLEIHMHIQYARRWVKVDNFALLTNRLCWQSDMTKQRQNTIVMHQKSIYMYLVPTSKCNNSRFCTEFRPTMAQHSRLPTIFQLICALANPQEVGGGVVVGVAIYSFFRFHVILNSV